MCDVTCKNCLLAMPPPLGLMRTFVHSAIMYMYMDFPIALMLIWQTHLTCAVVNVHVHVFDKEVKCT